MFFFSQVERIGKIYLCIFYLKKPSEAVKNYCTFNGGLSLRLFFRVTYCVCYKKYELFVVYYILVIPLGVGGGEGWG
jgi:hypothetical protein